MPHLQIKIDLGGLLSICLLSGRGVGQERSVQEGRDLVKFAVEALPVTGPWHNGQQSIDALILEGPCGSAGDLQLLPGSCPDPRSAVETADRPVTRN